MIERKRGNEGTKIRRNERWEVGERERTDEDKR